MRTKTENGDYPKHKMCVRIVVVYSYYKNTIPSKIQRKAAIIFGENNSTFFHSVEWRSMWVVHMRSGCLFSSYRFYNGVQYDLTSGMRNKYTLHSQLIVPSYSNAFTRWQIRHLRSASYLHYLCFYVKRTKYFGHLTLECVAIHNLLNHCNNLWQKGRLYDKIIEFTA